jgi:hypothetical protein
LRLEQQARVRFAAGAIVFAVVETHQNVVEGKCSPQPIVHPFYGLKGHSPPGNLRLVADHDEQESGIL